ncbi:MAG: hypothetical protein K2X27_20200 [Candidatus Obscuribacterales bacterium]|nr:hypothetical protein [Candidatus Obscuribacterales bacterium]
MKASKTAIWGLGILASVCLSPDAKAQMIDTKARQKASWYNAPREVQIIDERPVVRDFREAPSAPSMIQLPPGPQGFGGASGGGGGGAMGDGGGSPVLPAGGMPIGDGGPGYRGPSMGGLPLERAGFNRSPSNIPAGGIHPRGALPNGQTTGVHGSMMTPTAHSAGPAAGAGNRAAMAPVRAATPAASYGGNYTQAPAGASSGGGGASTRVQGVLLNRLKH